LVNRIVFYETVEYRFESKTENVTVVYSESDRAKIVRTLEPDDFDERKENQENEFMPRLQLFDTSREDYE
jgi:hypothetical protein